jgi:hypothetical protein
LSFVEFLYQHAFGYKIGHIEEKTASHNMNTPLLPLEAITLENLKYDMKDAQLFKVLCCCAAGIVISCV